MKLSQKLLEGDLYHLTPTSRIIRNFHVFQDSRKREE